MRGIPKLQEMFRLECPPPNAGIKIYPHPQITVHQIKNWKRFGERYSHKRYNNSKSRLNLLLA